MNFDLWQYLSGTDKPIVMYGMGNGADKILNVAKRYNIEISDFFASDGFVRGHSFKGKRVLSFSEIKNKYTDFIILLSFGSSLDDVLANIYSISERYEMYAPDVPVSGDNVFTYDFYESNKDKIEKARSMLCDEHSVNVFDNVVKYKLSGEISYLRKIDTDESEVYENLLTPDKYTSYVDLGAYNGDTVEQTLSVCPNVKDVIAVEPDVKNFTKLENRCTKFTDKNIILQNCVAWDSIGVLNFDASGNRNSNVVSQVTEKMKIKTVRADTLDNILKDKFRCDLIKYDVEGAEEKAIDGSYETIKRDTPDLIVSAYHRSEDIFSILLKLSEFSDRYDFYLRKFKYVPAWDLNIYAVNKNRK